MTDISNNDTPHPAVLQGQLESTWKQDEFPCALICFRVFGPVEVICTAATDSVISN